jgi:mannose-6-phosphate isomerase-like protein (cupin superfamily)
MMADATVLRPGEGQTIVVANTRTTFKIKSAGTDGRFSLAEYTLPAGFPGPPPHVHRKFEHAWYVLAGAVQVQLGEQSIQATTGTFVHIPTGVPHTFSNPGSDEARMLAIDLPGGLEPYYEELAAAFPPGTPLDCSIVAEIQQRYDTYPAGT